MATKEVCRRQPAYYELVLGGGGIKGFGHIGFLAAITEKGIRSSTVTGVSIGSAGAAFLCNGYSPAQMLAVFLAQIKRFNSPKGRALRRNGLIDLRALFRELTDEFALKPRENLRILAYDPVKRKPVLFEGVDYDLATALAASCAVPLLMRPVWYGMTESITKRRRLEALLASWRGQSEGGLLVDGGVHHPHPTEFCKEKAIVSRLGLARQLPSERLTALELAMHLLEMSAARLVDRWYADNGDHIVVRTGMPDVATLSFSAPETQCRKMVEYGYQATMKALQRAAHQGLLAS